MYVTALGEAERDFPGEAFLFASSTADAYSRWLGHRRWERDRWRFGHWWATGDCFRAAVDVGRPALGARVALFDPHVVVFTHDDDDHIDGATTFFTDLARQQPRYREFWMPADWLLLLEALASLRSGETASSDSDPSGSQVTLHEVDEDSVLATIEVETGDGVQDLWFPPLVDAFVPPDREPLTRHRAVEPEGEGRDLADLLALAAGETPSDEVLEDAIVETVLDDRDFMTRLMRVLGIDAPTSRSNEKWKDTAAAIAKRAVARSAVVTNLIARAAEAGQVRWFSHDAAALGPNDLWTSEGLPGLLTVVNAREVHPERVRRTYTTPARTLVALQALTVQNRRALVTFGWPRREMPGSPSGVLFWSDSDGKFAEVGTRARRPFGLEIPWAQTGLMTAPHHGSAVLDHRRIWIWMPDRMRVVLSRNREADTQAFFDVPDAMRGCTCCHLGGGKYAPGRDVHVVLGEQWTFVNVCRRECHARP